MIDARLSSRPPHALLKIHLGGSSTGQMFSFQELYFRIFSKLDGSPITGKSWINCSWNSYQDINSTGMTVAIAIWVYRNVTTLQHEDTNGWILTFKFLCTFHVGKSPWGNIYGSGQLTLDGEVTERLVLKTSFNGRNENESFWHV